MIEDPLPYLGSDEVIFRTDYLIIGDYQHLTQEFYDLFISKPFGYFRK
jgi:hypothetical protein